MTKNAYQDFSDTIDRLNNLLHEINRSHSYIPFTQEEQYLIDLLKDKVKASEQEVKKLDIIKETIKDKLYHYHNIYKRNEYFFVENMDNYYIAYLSIGGHNDTREQIGDFICCFDEFGNLTRDSVLGEKLIYSDKSGFLVGKCTDKKEEINYYNFSFYYLSLKEGIWQMTTKIDNLREFYVINENLLYFESNIDNSLMIYNKKNQQVIITEIDKIESLSRRKEKFDNFEYTKHSLITKKITSGTNTINTYFMIDEYGNIASNVIDEAGNIYVVSKEKELNTALKETFKQIEENLQNNLTQSFSPKLTLSKLPKLEVKKK